MTEKVVHILRHGRSHCGMSGVPGRWPEGHVWVSFDDPEHAAKVNCPKCIAMRAAYKGIAALAEHDFGNRFNDEMLLAFRELCVLGITKQVALPPIPLECIVALCDEIVEKRALAAGAVEELLKERGGNDGQSIAERPTDKDLRETTDTWHNIASKAGPCHRVSMPVLALLTLGEEIIELRKAPRA